MVKLLTRNSSAMRERGILIQRKKTIDGKKEQNGIELE